MDEAFTCPDCMSSDTRLLSQNVQTQSLLLRFDLNQRLSRYLICVQLISLTE